MTKTSLDPGPLTGIIIGGIIGGLVLLWGIWKLISKRRTRFFIPEGYDPVLDAEDPEDAGFSDTEGVYCPECGKLNPEAATECSSVDCQAFL